MRLIELTANQPTFKSIRFNSAGITLIAGVHKYTKKADLKRTVNGVGKSLTIALVNYCLGSNKNDHFDTHLQDWSFTLVFEHEGIAHKVTRTPGKAKLSFDGEEITLKKYRELLENLSVFDLPSSRLAYLTLRSLISFFVRPRRGSYVSYNRPEPKWTEYQSILCQSFLLGLDYELAARKHDHKVRLDEQLELADRYKKDKELKQFYLGEKAAEVELVELKGQIAKLESDLAEFRVADDYAERQRAANALHDRLLENSNQLTMLQNVVADIDLALTIRPDVTPEQITSVYEEAKLYLPENVRVRLDQVQRFYQRLFENRKRRLTIERQQAQKTIEDLLSQNDRLKADLDAELQFLNAHQALDEYVENNRKLSELIAKRRKIEDYQLLLTRYIESAQRIRLEMAQAAIDAGQYIHAIKAYLDSLMDKFREYSKELYGNVHAGLTVRNNDGENQCRYDIDAHIQDDAGDGINHAKMFCYDMLLLTSGQRHKMKFVFHDSRLYADLDPHQLVSIFRIAERECRRLGVQYIATISGDQIDSVRNLAGSDLQRLFVDPVVVELTDAPGGTGKLLGVQIDMEYESD